MSDYIEGFVICLCIVGFTVVVLALIFAPILIAFITLNALWLTLYFVTIPAVFGIIYYLESAG